MKYIKNILLIFFLLILSCHSSDGLMVIIKNTDNINQTGLRLNTYNLEANPPLLMGNIEINKLPYKIFVKGSTTQHFAIQLYICDNETIQYIQEAEFIHTGSYKEVTVLMEDRIIRIKENNENLLLDPHCGVQSDAGIDVFDADADADADADTDTDSDTDTDIDTDSDTDTDTDIDTDSDIDAQIDGDIESDLNIDIQTCTDNDGDQFGTNCTLGEDCDDVDINNWNSCETCIDSDGDNYFTGCDSYQTINGPDCDDTTTWCNLDCSDINSNSVFDCKEDTWMLTIGGADWEEVYSVIEISNNEFFLVGKTCSFGNGNCDMWLMKLNNFGNIVWQKTFGGSEDDEATSVIETSDNGFVVVGYTESYGEGGGDVWLLKLDSNGGIEWQKTIGRTGYEWAYIAIETSDKGFVVVGYTESYGEGGNLWLLKLNSNGGIEWQKTIGGSGWDFAYSVVETSDGGIIISLDTTSYGAGMGDLWAIKLNSSGGIEWQKTIGGTGDEWAYSVIESYDNGFVFAGVTTSYGAQDEGDIWLLKLNSNGEIVWQKTIGGTGWEGAGVINTSDNGFLVEGYTNSYGAGGGEIWLIKLNSDGEIIWQKTIGTLGEDFSRSAIETSNGDFLITGGTYSYSNGDADIWVMKLNSNSEIWGLCDLIQDLDVTFQGSDATVTDTYNNMQNTYAKVHNTSVILQDSTVTSAFICPQ